MPPFRGKWPKNFQGPVRKLRSKLQTVPRRNQVGPGVPPLDYSLGKRASHPLIDLTLFIHQAGVISEDERVFTGLEPDVTLVAGAASGTLNMLGVINPQLHLVSGAPSIVGDPTPSIPTTITALSMEVLKPASEYLLSTEPEKRAFTRNLTSLQSFLTPTVCEQVVQKWRPFTIQEAEFFFATLQQWSQECRHFFLQKFEYGLSVDVCFRRVLKVQRSLADSSLKSYSSSLRSFASFLFVHLYTDSITFTDLLEFIARDEISQDIFESFMLSRVLSGRKVTTCIGDLSAIKWLFRLFQPNKRFAEVYDLSIIKTALKREFGSPPNGAWVWPFRYLKNFVEFLQSFPGRRLYMYVYLWVFIWANRSGEIENLRTRAVLTQRTPEGRVTQVGVTYEGQKNCKEWERHEIVWQLGADDQLKNFLDPVALYEQYTTEFRPDPNGFFFTDLDGAQFTNKSLNTHFQEDVAKFQTFLETRDDFILSGKRIVFHAFRASFVGLCMDLKVRVQSIAAITRHKSLQCLQDSYEEKSRSRRAQTVNLELSHKIHESSGVPGATLHESFCRRERMVTQGSELPQNSVQLSGPPRLEVSHLPLLETIPMLESPTSQTKTTKRKFVGFQGTFSRKKRRQRLLLPNVPTQLPKTFHTRSSRPGLRRNVVRLDCTHL